MLKYVSYFLVLLLILLQSHETAHLKALQWLTLVLGCLSIPDQEVGHFKG